MKLGKDFQAEGIFTLSKIESFDGTFHIDL